MYHFTSFFLNSKSNVLVKRVLFLLCAALATRYLCDANNVCVCVPLYLSYVDKPILISS
jgi:hypothetical protein